VNRRPPTRPHVPQRPLWLCRNCAQPWPCGRAKIELLREHATDPTHLRIYLCSQLHEALRDLRALRPDDRLPTPAETFNRFLSWVAPGSRPHPVSRPRYGQRSI
jgi:hypothetical protein